MPLERYIYNETRYTMLRQSNPEGGEGLLMEAQQDVKDRWKMYENWPSMPVNGGRTGQKQNLNDTTVRKGAGND